MRYIKNPMAKDVRQPKYKQQVIPDKKKPVLTRKKNIKEIVMKVKRISPFSGITHTMDLDVTVNQLISWEKGN